MALSADAQMRSVNRVRKAAKDLSSACVDTMRAEASPIVVFYDNIMLEQEIDFTMIRLLREIK